MNPKLQFISSVSTTVFIVVTYIVFRKTLVYKYLLPTSCGNNETCVRFCCPYENSCRNDTEVHNWKIPNGENLGKNYRIIKGLPCGELHNLDNWTFTNNGQLIDEVNQTYNWNEYCYLHDQDNVLICPPADEIEEARKIFPYLMISSIPFLIATLIVYGIVRELRSLRGKCVMSYVLSLTLMYSSVAAVGLYNHTLLTEFNFTCKCLGYLIMATILMCFFWLNVMCYEIWSSVRSLTPKRHAFQKFFNYCVYAFGLPTVAVLLVAIFNEFGVIPEYWSTGLGVHSCSIISDVLNGSSPELDEWNNRRQWLYMYGPIMLILGVNVGFYATTACTIYRVQEDVKKFSEGGRSKRAKKDTERFALYSRFFVMMGLPWLIEISSWLAGDTIFLYLASIINCLQGFIIFVMFVLHKRIFRLIMKRLNPSRYDSSLHDLDEYFALESNNCRELILDEK